MLKFKALLLTVMSSSLLLGCNAGKNQTNIELIQDMMDQISVKTQDWDPDSEDYSTVMVPPEGTVQRDNDPYKYTLDPLKAGKELKNPLGDDYTPETMKLGKVKYEIYCMVCHGEKGAGNGTVAPKMAVKPPSLLSTKVREHSDGRLYHIITAGQGVMGQYASQIHSKKDRWAIVNYVRSLQKQAQ